MSTSITENAKFSGKGTMMCSPQGVQTISSYVCYKHGYTEEELQATGLTQPANPTKLAQAEEKDPFKDAHPKVFTNSNQGGGINVDRKVLQIRSDIKKKQKVNDEREIQSIVANAIDHDGKTFLEKHCRNELYTSAN